MEETLKQASIEDIISLTEYIAKNLVENTDEVKINLKEDDETVTLELSVAKDDMGKVIGKQGRIAKAIRTVVRAASIHSEKKVLVEIV